MARKKIRPKNRKQPTPEWLINYLTSGKIPKMFEGGAVECWNLQGGTVHSDGLLKTAWLKERAWILKHFKQNNPGTRPWPWWRFDAPRWKHKHPGDIDGREFGEPRKRLGGIGTPDYEVLGYKPCIAFGVPQSFVDPFSVEYYNGRARDIHGELIPCDKKYKEGYFKGVAIDPDDPPIYESEPAYLKRHGLLSKTEESLLSDADFKPVSILEIREKQAE